MAAKQDPYVTRAHLATLLRYQPELDALSMLLKQAQDRRDAGVAGARAAARGTVALIDQTRPQLQQIYNVPGVAQAAQAPALPAGTLDFASAQKFEQQGAAQRLMAESSRAQADLLAQRTAAAAGEQYGAQQARAQYAKDEGDIADRLKQITGEQGAFEASTLLDLVDKGNDRRSTNAQKQADRSARAQEGKLNRRNARVVKGVNASGQVLPGRGKPGKQKAELAGSLKLKQQIIDNRAHYERLLNSTHTGGPRKGKRWTRAEIANDARNHGVPTVVLNAAADLANFGYILPHHATDLRTSGVRVPKAWLPTQTKKQKASLKKGLSEVNIPPLAVPDAGS